MRVLEPRQTDSSKERINSQQIEVTSHVTDLKQDSRSALCAILSSFLRSAHCGSHQRLISIIRSGNNVLGNQFFQ